MSNSGSQRCPAGGTAEKSSLADSGLQVGTAVLCAMALTCCALMGPDHRGLGTHERLGLPRCSYLERTGVPCPTCGATTSACLFVRGRFGASLAAHPMGFVTALLLVLAIPFSLWCAWRGWPWAAHLHRVRTTWWTAAACAFLLLSLWGWQGRIERHLALAGEARRAAHATSPAAVPP